MYLILIIVLAIILVLLFVKSPVETYSSIGSDIDNYYQWRPYQHNVYDHIKMSSFPYNYHPYEHNQRFNCYGANDINFYTL